MNGPILVGSVLGLLDGPISPMLAALSTMTQARIGNEFHRRVTSVHLLLTNALVPVASIVAGSLDGVMGVGSVIEAFGALTLFGGLAAPLLGIGRVTLQGEHEPNSGTASPR